MSWPGGRGTALQFGPGRELGCGAAIGITAISPLGAGGGGRAAASMPPNITGGLGANIIGCWCIIGGCIIGRGIIITGCMICGCMICGCIIGCAIGRGCII